ncbi:KpsF/GutQ family sugar-phosphate isomerase [Pedobacter sp. LMG 31464]|uniref:KpsF/GutQ family sugar-phosphate isomerase n=1 Tax=Pedobacter planticolens TaxID=2679964 RepID=A0A923IUJ8_9SPHI|nr:KpsF/GutQ family sugar-phosphate isomerase [Pedobacter planticolens]MBB2144961.1 KpsF/GutQ family sugar-phosphate isomerase [Pedobacter planticolens]
MKSKKSIIETAISTLKLESEAILNLLQHINEDFVKVVHAILKSKGRVIVTGIGKSAIIAQKIVATFNSTGTPAIFMHAADAVHGDLGMIQQDDIVICLSKSGNTPEIKLLAPLLKQSGNLLIGMLGSLNSDLAKQADLILNTTVEKEACPHNLAPTTSTTAQLAMGDALAICLLEEREFNTEDFARYHPGGSLGKRLYLKVGDLAAKNEKPSISPSASVKDVIIEISKNRLGAVVVIADEKILGVITDGDIRRMLENHTNIENITAADLMSINPKRIDKDELALLALELIKKNNITQLLVTTGDTYYGMVHLHDLLQEGII